MGLDQGLDERQSESESLAALAVATAVIRLEQVGRLVGGHADTRVADGDPARRILPALTAADRALVGVGDGVAQQVVQNLRQPLRIGVDEHRRRRESHDQLQSFALGPRLHAFDRRRDRLGDVDRRPFEPHASMPDARDVEQIVDQAGHVLRLPRAER